MVFNVSTLGLDLLSAFFIITLSLNTIGFKHEWRCYMTAFPLTVSILPSQVDTFTSIAAGRRAVVANREYNIFISQRSLDIRETLQRG